MSNTVYIYVLREKGNAEIRYVGQTIVPAERLNSHIYSGNALSTHPKEKWIGRVLHAGGKIEMNIIEECDEDIWEEREKYWISHYLEQGESLTNLHPGGKIDWHSRKLSDVDTGSAIVYLKPWAIETLERMKVACTSCLGSQDEDSGHDKALLGALNYWRWMHPQENQAALLIDGLQDAAYAINKLPFLDRAKAGAIARDIFYEGGEEFGFHWGCDF